MTGSAPIQAYIDALNHDIDRVQAAMDQLKAAADSAVIEARKRNDEVEELIRQLKNGGGTP